MTVFWDPNAVKSALVEAFTVDRLIGGRVGPKMYGNAMPSYFSDDVDVFIMEKEDAEPAEKGGTGGEHFRKLQEERRASIASKQRITPAQVSRMERILLGEKNEPSWLYGLLQGQDSQRVCLEAFSIQTASCSLRGREFKENRFCKRVGWAYSTYRSRRDKAAEIITFNLNARGVGCWVEGLGKPDTDPRDVPLTYVLMEFLKSGPKSKYQFVAFCHNHRVIPAKDIRDNAVARAIGMLMAQGQIRRLPDNRLERIRK